MPLLYDAQYWRDRAEEARAIAATMVTAEGRQTMLEVAKLHDRMAALAERTRESDLAPPHWGRRRQPRVGRTFGMGKGRVAPRGGPPFHFVARRPWSGHVRCAMIDLGPYLLSRGLQTTLPGALLPT